MKYTAIAAIALMGLISSADAATLSMTIVINSSASTTITCPVTSTFSAPVAAGTVICPITVAPATWSGTLSLSGANAASFAISSGTGQSLVVGNTPITAPGNLAVTINAAP